MITPEDVEHIGRLARIDLTKTEKEKFQKELSGILSFVEKLNELDTERVRPVSGGTTLENKTRGDDPAQNRDPSKAEQLIRQAPEAQDRWIKVKAVFEQS